MGKPEAPVVVKPRGPQKSPISKGWIGTYSHTTQHNQTNAREERGLGRRGEEKRGLERKGCFANAGVYSSACLHALRRSAVRGAEDVLLSYRNGMAMRYADQTGISHRAPIDRFCAGIGRMRFFWGNGTGEESVVGWTGPGQSGCGARFAKATFSFLTGDGWRDGWTVPSFFYILDIGRGVLGRYNTSVQ
jgi:hypothetical protein